MTIEEVLAKHQYRRLTAEEARASRATHQHERAYENDETFALTLDLADDWTHFDDRGDESRSGETAEELDSYLTAFHLDDEED